MPASNRASIQLSQLVAVLARLWRGGEAGLARLVAARLAAVRLELARLEAAELRLTVGEAGNGQRGGGFAIFVDYSYLLPF